MDVLSALHSMGLGPETKGPEGEKMVTQAKQVWSMLDDMADSDPDAYQRFIDKQRKEQRELTAPPAPHLCVKTQFQSHGGGTLFVNILSWSRIPKPKSPEDNVPLYATPMENFKDKKLGETVSAIFIATNPELLAEFGREAKSLNDQRDFINLNLDYVQHLSGKSVGKNFFILPGSQIFKGDLEAAQKFCTDSLKKAMKKPEKPAASKNGGDQPDDRSDQPDIDLPESMLSKLTSIATSMNAAGPPSNQSNGSSHPMQRGPPMGGLGTVTGQPMAGPGRERAGKTSLIEELESSEVTLPEPRYTLERSECGGELELRVELPGVSSVKQCTLDISKDDVKLYVDGKFDLTVTLPSDIEDCESRAKFSKKQSTLTLCMPLLQS